MASSDDAPESPGSCSTAMSGTSSPNYMRATTSSSARKGSSQASSGTSPVHVCSYSYCSLNGHQHHHHAPSLPLKEFISANRKMVNNRKGKQFRDDMVHSTKKDQSTQIVAEVVNSTQEDEVADTDCLNTICGNPRKKWVIEGHSSNDSQALTDFTCNQTGETDYEQELAETPSKKSQPEVRQEVFNLCDVATNGNNHQETRAVTSYETVESVLGEGKTWTSGDDLIDILSDKNKYTWIWNLIYQHVISGDVIKSQGDGISDANDKEKGDVNTCLNGNEMDQEQSKCKENLNQDEENQAAATENTELNQTVTVRLVQEVLSAILQPDNEFKDFKPDQDMTNSLAKNLTHSTMQRKTDSSEEEKPRKIIDAIERMMKISPQRPRDLYAQPISEKESVYLRHINRNERENTEEWMLDYELGRVISMLGHDQGRRVAELVEAFETLIMEQKECVRQYPMKGKPIITNELAIRVNDEPEQTMFIPDEQVNLSRQHSLGEYRQQVHDHTIGKSIYPDQLKVEMQLSEESDREHDTNNSSQYSPEVIHDKGMDIPTPPSFGFHENEAIKLVRETISELLILPEQADDNQPISTSTTTRTETSVDTIATLEDKKALPTDTYTKLLMVIMCKKFIKEMDKMRQLKLLPPRELSCTIHLEGEGTPSLHHTTTGERRSWEEWMIDHVLQRVIKNLSQAQKRRVSLLVQAFETVGSQGEPTSNERGNPVKPETIRCDRKIQNK